MLSVNKGLYLHISHRVNENMHMKIENCLLILCSSYYESVYIEKGDASTLLKFINKLQVVHVNQN